MSSDVHAWLARFDAAATPGPFAAPFLHHHDGGVHALHLMVGVATHGDETGPLPAATRLVEDLRAGRRHYGGRLTVAVGNPEAARAGRRFLEADLNRVCLDAAPDSLERRRCVALTPALDAADLFLDLHQTHGERLDAFWTLPWSLEAWRWIRIIGGGQAWTTRPSNQGSFASGTRCLDEHVRLRGRPGLTLEMSGKGLTASADRISSAALDRLLEAGEAVGRGADPGQLAATLPEPRYLITAHKEPFGDPRRALRPGLSNFHPVQAGEPLEAPGSPPVSSPLDGMLLFPKYPPRDSEGRALAPAPVDLFNLVVEPPRHPLEMGWPGELV